MRNAGRHSGERLSAEAARSIGRTIQDEFDKYKWIDNEGRVYQGTPYAVEPGAGAKFLWSNQFKSDQLLACDNRPLADRPHRTIQQWLGRHPQEEELRYYRQEVDLQHDGSSTSCPPRIRPPMGRTDATSGSHRTCKIPRGPPAATIMSEHRPRAAPDVHTALRKDDPAQRPASATAIAKKAPPTTSKGMLKAFVRGTAPPLIGAGIPTPPPPATMPTPTPATPAQPAVLPLPFEPVPAASTSKHLPTPLAQDGPPAKQAR